MPSLVNGNVRSRFIDSVMATVSAVVAAMTSGISTMATVVSAVISSIVPTVTTVVAAIAAKVPTVTTVVTVSKPDADSAAVTV